MNSQHLEMICQRFQLGAPVAAPQPVAGGRVHQMWRAETTQGAFAIKQLHPQIIQQPGARDAYKHSEQLATAMADAGIPAVPALTYRKHPVLKVGKSAVLVFPWIDGTKLPFSTASPEQAQQIGTLLGRMHALHVTIPGLALPTWRVLRDDDWVLLARRAAEQHAPWAEAVRASLRALCWWSRLARDANPRLWNRLVVSHGDMGQSNVLWRDAHTPALIDWEGAGLINPSLELVKAALDWSGISVSEPDEASFQAVLAGYRNTGEQAHESAHDALAGVLGHWLEWLEFNMRRSLDKAVSPEEQLLGASETARALATLQRIGEDVGRVAAWVEAGNPPPDADEGLSNQAVL